MSVDLSVYDFSTTDELANRLKHRLGYRDANEESCRTCFFMKRPLTPHEDGSVLCTIMKPTLDLELSVQPTGRCGRWTKRMHKELPC